MFNRDRALFIETILLDDILQYNVTKQCVEFNLQSLFKKCFPGVNVVLLDFKTATTLVQKELLKTGKNNLYRIKDADESYFLANKAAWVFSILFGCDLVLNWNYSVIVPPEYMNQENRWPSPTLPVTSFLRLIERHVRTQQITDTLSQFDIVLRYVTHGKLGSDFDCEKSDMFKCHQQPHELTRGSSLFVNGISGSDDSTGSLLFGIKDEDGGRGKPFKSCIPFGEEYLVRHPEWENLSRAIPVLGDPPHRNELTPLPLLDCFKDWHQHGRRRVDDGHMLLEEFEKVVDQIRHMYYRGPLHPIEKEDESNVKQDEPKEKPAYGIQFYVCHPYKGKYSK